MKEKIVEIPISQISDFKNHPFKVKEDDELLKLAIKATTSSIKAIIAGSKTLISALIAGGWIAVIIIIICCLIGLFCNSVFGIFLSNEDVEKNNITINDVVRELNNEVSIKISNIQQSTRYDECIITSNQAEWKIILSIYIAPFPKILFRHTSKSIKTFITSIISAQNTP